MSVLLFPSMTDAAFGFLLPVCRTIRLLDGLSLPKGSVDDDEWGKEKFAGFARPGRARRTPVEVTHDRGEVF